ncbi:hypothetical protein BC833DRAFT_102057 [Globomyces pollinis-pini]|nr:hypothetical protein BC833DRAFT_102057 [Globomyces pollinis-pini]
MLIISLSILYMTVVSLVLSEYPIPNAKPPINKTWTDIFLQGTTIPTIPVNTAPIAVPNHADDLSTCPNPTDWAITYDDGPSQFTPKVLELLQEQNVKATFFVIGSNVLKFPEILLQVHQAGHQIGIHTWSHTALTTLTNDEIIAELVWTATIIKDITGQAPKYMRCPFGDIDERVRAVIKSMGLIVVWWNRDSKDFSYTNTPAQASAIDSSFVSWAASKLSAISLQHDIAQIPVDHVTTTLKIVIDAKYSIKTIAECVGDKEPYKNQFLMKAGIVNKSGTNPTGIIVNNEVTSTANPQPTLSPSDSPKSDSIHIFKSVSYFSMMALSTFHFLI